MHHLQYLKSHCEIEPKKMLCGTYTLVQSDTHMCSCTTVALIMLWSTFSACKYTCLCFKPRNWGSRQLHSHSDACFMQTSLNEILSAQEVWWKSMLFFIFFMFFQYRYEPKLAWLKVPQAYLSGNQAMTSKNSSNTLTAVAWRCMWSKILKK